MPKGLTTVQVIGNVKPTIFWDLMSPYASAAISADETWGVRTASIPFLFACRYASVATSSVLAPSGINKTTKENKRLWVQGIARGEMRIRSGPTAISGETFAGRLVIPKILNPSFPTEVKLRHLVEGLPEGACRWTRWTE